MNNMSDRAMAAWNTLTSQWGGPLSLTSAYRDPEYNASVGGARGSQHVHGNAFDVSTAGMTPEDRVALIKAAQAAGFTGFGGYDNSLHFDVGPSRTWGSDYTGATTPDWLRSALGSAPVQVSTSGGPSMPMQEQPRGLFGFLGGEQTPDARTADQRKADLFNTLALGFNEMRLRPSQSLATGIQNRMASDRQGRQQAMTTNRTIEWLRSQPNGEQYAQMIETGAIPAANAVQAWQQAQASAAAAAQGEVREVNGRLVRVMPDGTVQEIYGSANATPEQISQAGALRDDLNKELGDFSIVRSGYENIMTFYDDPNAVTDYALAVAFAKVLDPGSVAREGEVSAVANAGARVPALAQSLMNAITGAGSLTDEVRQQIAQATASIYSQKATSAQDVISKYERAASDYNIPWGLVYMGGEIPAARSFGAPAAPQSTPAPEGVDQKVWDEMTLEEKAAFQ